MLEAMSRGPTRRVRALIKTGALEDSVLSAADREADLLGHPYIGLEHLQLARRREGRFADYNALLRDVRPISRRRWWRPLGAHSAFRRRGPEQTAAAQVRARREVNRDSHPGGPPRCD
jgi:hypothetical protein